MEVILIDDVFELGRRGQIVRVADGYGRNYLIPKRLAIPATPGNLKIIEQQRLSIAKKEAKYTEEAELLAQELGQTHVLISRKSGDAGTLFGSVTSKDIMNLLKTSEIQIDRRKIMLQQPIKSIGNYRISIRLHSDVTAELLVSILLEGDQPVARVKKKDEESDQIVSELDARVQEIRRLARTEETPAEEATEAVEEATAEEAPAEEATKATEAVEEAPAEEATEATEAVEEATAEEAPAEEATEATEAVEEATAEEAPAEEATKATEAVEEATAEEAPAEEATEAVEEATAEEAPAEEATEAVEEAPAEEATEAAEEGESLTEEGVVEKKTKESTID